MQKKTFTENYITNLNVAGKGKRYEVVDGKNPYLRCRVTDKGTKTFIVYKKILGRPVRVTLGRHPALSVEKARQLAYSTLDMIADKKNPNIENKKISQKITLSELFDYYMDKYSKKYTKQRTWEGNLAAYRLYLQLWNKRQVISLSKFEIETHISKICEAKGIHAANRALVLLRHIINKGIEWGLNIPNPTLGIKKYRTKSRDRFLQPDELQRLFSALEQEKNVLFRSYFYISLYTGQRRSNVLSMRWNDINFNNQTWYIPDTKNGDPLTIPLVPQAIEVFKNLERTSIWVFPSKSSKSGHIEEPKKVWKRILQMANISNLRIHDIRRTLGSYEAISGASMNIIGKSLGHKTFQATQIYARLSVDPVRNAMGEAVSLMDKYKEQYDVSSEAQ